MNDNSGNVISFNDNSFYPQCIKFHQPKAIQQLNIKLTYADGTEVNLNGSEIELLFEYDV